MKIRVQKEAWDAAKQQHPVCHRWYPRVLPLQHRSRTLLRPSTAQCHGKQEVFAEDICHLLIKHWEMPCWALLHVWTHSSCRMGWVSVVRLFSQHRDLWFLSILPHGQSLTCPKPPANAMVAEITSRISDLNFGWF